MSWFLNEFGPVKWVASSRWSFRLNPGWGSIETITIRKMHPTLISDVTPDKVLSNVPIFPLHKAIVPSSLATRTKQFTIPRVLNLVFIKYYGFYQPVYGTWPLFAMWWEAAWFWRRSFTLSIGATQVLLEKMIKMSHNLWVITWYHQRLHRAWS